MNSMRSGSRPTHVETVVIVNDHAFVNGGQAKIAIETALALRAAGLSVIFFAGVGPPDVRLEQSGIHSICLSQFDILTHPSRLRAALYGIWNFDAARKLGKLLRQLNPSSTVIHVHGWAKALSPSIGPIVTSGRIPHVYTMHEYFLACPNGGFYDYRAGQICLRKPLGASCLTTHCDSRRRAHKAWRVGRQFVLRSIGAMPRGLRDVIYLTNVQLRAIHRYLPQKARVHHLPNPVQRTATHRIQAEDNELFLFVGRLSPEKGAEVAAKAARAAGVKIAFAGEGECRTTILAANPSAHVLGWLAPEMLRAWMARARCLVFPSLWYEGYPMSVVEAMQAGLPILVSDRSAAAEIVRHNTDGLHVKTGNPAAWAEAMRLLSDHDRVLRYSRSSFEASHCFLNAETYTARLLTIYQEASRIQASEHLGRASG
jgi:glycosyltransferase involved in cell wall biosynthesis